MVGLLNGTQSESMLANVCFFESNDNKTVQKAIMETCHQDNIYSHVHLILSDEARYMVKAMEEIKRNSLMFPNVNHITCLAHALNLVANEIQKQYHLVNKFLSDSKKFLLKSNKRRQDFISKTGPTLPPTPVLTRWGTWLKSVDFYLLNYTKVKQFI